MNRQKANIQILWILLKYCLNPKHKDLRFWQVLINSGIIEYHHFTPDGKPVILDCYNEESQFTLNKIQKAI